MGTRLVLVSDTHVPKRARWVPDIVLQAMADADVVVHAGDWVDAGTLDLFERSSRRLVGVYGNNDGPDLRSRLPERARFEIDGIRFALVHETGPSSGRERRVDEAFPDTDVLVFGHSHIPWDTRSPGGMRLLNPGSPTDRRRQSVCTFMTATIRDGELSVDLVRVPGLSRAPA
ncbi:metallophosphoesterase [Rathayibacter sp. YIM 133350]|uniref:metallophosphoesterase family protein n=1 Tax=Rathayibacter sp. YIM 133350 TaxID=3131992 RepID=UPI00307D3989